MNQGLIPEERAFCQSSIQLFSRAEFVSGIRLALASDLNSCLTKSAGLLRRKYE
jgi:hypothetical protein